MSPPVVVDSKKILNLRAKSYAHYIGPFMRRQHALEYPSVMHDDIQDTSVQYSPD